MPNSNTIDRHGVIAIAVSAAIAFSANYASGQEYSARLNAFNEIGGLSDETEENSRAILNKGTGEFKLHLHLLSKSRDGRTPRASPPH
jgi:hypothetical protein